MTNKPKTELQKLLAEQEAADAAYNAAMEKRDRENQARRDRMEIAQLESFQRCVEAMAERSRDEAIAVIEAEHPNLTGGHAQQVATWHGALVSARDWGASEVERITALKTTLAG